ncbi:hypothetical protein M9H77_22894 [Catharanthus roseus]|uniref:Uncharacterized protein n=1 Tax=Catharanthus roseus TaxID=4058 RepID=A0ACC0AVS2_CATRO|nr:hypothetical protein M9H77_22894 [Catharanthus roseus]
MLRTRALKMHKSDALCRCDGPIVESQEGLKISAVTRYGLSVVFVKSNARTGGAWAGIDYRMPMASKTQSPDHAHKTMVENPQERQHEQLRKETSCLGQANSGILEKFIATMMEFFETFVGTRRAEGVPTTGADSTSRILWRG